jgi:transposase InsO family protein
VSGVNAASHQVPRGDAQGVGGEGTEVAPDKAGGLLGEARGGEIPWGARRRRKLRGSLQKPEVVRGPLTAAKKILLLDTWRRSGLPARDFAALTGLSHHTLYVWQRKFKLEGPAGLEDKPRGGPRGSRLSEITRRTIILLKEAHPEWGTERISAMLLRGPGLGASPGTVARVLHESGYERRDLPTRRHPEQVRRFERARPNDLWQTDLFTFVLKRQNRRVYLVAFMDDHSRFLVSYGLHATQSAALVIEVLRSGIASYQTPREILTDNGAQYITWRGKGAFTRECQKHGIRQIVAKPRRPQTLGKIERFWGTLWRECVETAVFLDMADAQKRIGLFIDHYNFQRPHSALGGLVPADRFFGAAPEVLKALKARVAANALELARGGVPRAPFYLAGNAGGQAFSVHAEGERVILKHGEGERQEIDLVVPQAKAPELPEPLCPMGSPAGNEGEDADADGDGDGDGDEDVPEPGTSPLDDALEPIFEGEEREVLQDAEAPASWDEVESAEEEDDEELEGGEQP